MTARRTQVLIACVALVCGIATAVAARRPATAAPAPAVAGTTPTAGSYEALPPARLVDTRWGLGAPRGAVGGNRTLTVAVAGKAGIPASGVSAVVLTVTAVWPKQSGYLTAYPSGTSRPGTSNINFAAGQTVADAVVTRLGSGGRVNLYNGSYSAIQLVVDVSGFYRGGAATTPGAFNAVTPNRVLDTRSGLGVRRGPVIAGGTIALPVAGRGGVPARGVSAVVLTVTVTSPQRSGYVTAFADRTSRPGTSNVNFAANQTIADLVVARVGTDGKVDLYNGSAGATQLIADVSGYFLAGSPAAPGAFIPTTPTRIYDSRRPGTPGIWPGPNGVAQIRAIGAAGVPADGVSAVMVTVTIVAPHQGGVVTEYARNTTLPGTSNLNFSTGRTTAAGFLARLGTDGRMVLYLSGGDWAENFIIDVTGYVTGAAPLDWSAPTAIDPLAPRAIGSVSCPAATFCAAAASNSDVLTFDGTSWTASHLPSSIGLQAVSCPVVGVCLAVNADGVVWKYQGSSWGQPVQTSMTNVHALSCPTTDFCVATGKFGAVYTFDGADWSLAFQDSERIVNSVSCVSPTFCIGVDSWGTVFTYDGAIWTNTATIPEADVVSCTATDVCEILTFGSDAYRFDGSQWRSDGSAGVSSPSAMSCVGVSFCAVVGRAGSASTNAGSGWVSASLPDSVRALTVACPTADRCVTGSVDGSIETYDGAAWSAPQPVDPSAGDPSGMSCAAVDFCAVVDAWGNAMTYNGSAWTAPDRVSARALVAVACASRSFCVALDNAGSVLTFDGTSWSSPVAVAAGNAGIAVSCSSTTFCMALWWRGSGATLATAYVDGTWQSPASLDFGPDNAGPAALSCGGPGSCVALTTAGAAVSYSAGTWGAPVRVVTGPGLDAVACPTANRCVALDGDFGWFGYDGRQWTSTRDPDLAGAAGLYCVTATSCVATAWTTSGYVGLNTFDGTTWSLQELGPWLGIPVGISCSDVRTCLVVTADGDALTSS